MQITRRTFMAAVASVPLIGVVEAGPKPITLESIYDIGFQDHPWKFVVETYSSGGIHASFDGHEMKPSVKGSWAIFLYVDPETGLTAEIKCKRVSPQDLLVDWIIVRDGNDTAWREHLSSDPLDCLIPREQFLDRFRQAADKTHFNGGDLAGIPFWIQPNG